MSEMTGSADFADLEDRLRAELPELADEMIRDGASSVSVGPVGARPRDGGSQRWFAIAAGLVVVALGVAGVRWLMVSDPEPQIATSPRGPEPASFGSWEPLPDAPIDPRAFAATGWTHSEVFFWAGSSLNRGTAYADGAAYSPSTGEWRTLEVPGWGHPGLTSAYGDGVLFAAAKGSGVEFDPVTGETNDLPQPDDMALAGVQFDGSEFYALGPVSPNSPRHPELGVARYDRDTNTWIAGPSYTGTEQQVALINNSGWFDKASGFGINGTLVVWHETEGGLAYDNAAAEWREIPAPSGFDGYMTAPDLVATSDGLVAVLRADADDEVLPVLLVGDRWEPLSVPIEVPSAATVAVTAAGNWMVVFAKDQAPVTLHVASGSWQRHDDGPLAGLEGANAVWTDGELIVWGGVASPTDLSPSPAQGAIWSPAG